MFLKKKNQSKYRGKKKTLTSNIK